MVKRIGLVVDPLHEYVDARNAQIEDLDKEIDIEIEEELMAA